MTKTQISVRVSPGTLAAIDAAAQAAGTSRGHIIDRWLTTQAKAQEANAVPVEQQAWYRAGELVAKAQSAIDRTASEPMTAWQHGVIATLGYLADAIGVLAGTAPEETQTVKYSISDGGTGQVFIGALRQVSATLDDLPALRRTEHSPAGGQ